MQRLFVLMLSVLIIFLNACSYRFGQPPRVEVLDSLRPGSSSAGDILLALGEPRGHGVARLSSELPEPRDIWFYEYTEAEGKNIKLKMLLVFLQDDVFDGYLWFDSSTHLSRQED